MLKKSNRISGSIFTNWEYLFLVLSVPAIQLAEFFAISGGQVSETLVVNKSFLPYFYLVVFLLVIYRSKYESKQVFLFVFLLCYTFFYDKFSLANNASYLIPYVLTCSLLLLKPEKFVQLTKRQDNIIVGSYFFLILIYYAFSQERFYEDRFYLVGFVIPHQFSYYCAILTFYLLSKDKLYLAVLVTIAGAYVGARSGLLASLVCYVYYFSIISKKRRLSVIGSVLVLGGLAILYAAFNGGIFDKLTAQFEVIFSSSNNQSSSSTDTRTLLWLNMWKEVSRDGFDFINFFGRGPRSSYAYNNSTLGLELWMHNDVVEIFFTLGLSGILIYFYSFYRFYKLYQNIFTIIFVFVLIATNGFFTYIPLTMIAFFRLLPRTNRKGIIKI